MPSLADKGNIANKSIYNVTEFKATGSKSYDDQALDDQVMKIYSSNPDYHHVLVQGPHHVHLNTPEVVAPHIQKFIQRYSVGDHKV